MSAAGPVASDRLQSRPMQVVARTAALVAVIVLIALRVGSMLHVPLPPPLVVGVMTAAVVTLFVMAVMVMVLRIHDRSRSLAPSLSRPVPSLIRDGIAGLLRNRRKIAICIVICFIVLGGLAWLIAWESEQECVRWHTQRVGWWGREHRVCAETAPRPADDSAR
jgi:hypothetical protein